MSLIHPLKFRTLETGHFKTPRLQTSRLQMGVFQTVVAVAFELGDTDLLFRPPSLSPALPLSSLAFSEIK